jgi:hypothetical protein
MRPERTRAMHNYRQHDLAPELIAIATGACLLWFAFRQLIRWIQAAPLKPEPWGQEVEEEINRPDATPVCHKCFAPHSDAAWFCEKCGSAVGTYNNLMPYVCVFSEGEVLRNGVNERLRVNALTIVGYLVYSLNYLIVVPLVPVYWFFLFKNLARIKREESQPSDLEEAGG